MIEKKLYPLLFLLVFYLSVNSLAAFETIPLDQLVDFDITLKELVIQLNSPVGLQFEENKYLLLDGIVSTLDVIDPDPETFFAVLEMVQGEWKGLEEVVMYRCYIRLDGGEFASLFPERGQRTPGPENLQVNDKVLIAGIYAGYIDDETGFRYPVIDGFAVRKMR